MSVLTQPPTMGDVLKYELNPNFTRETVTLLAGTSYPVALCWAASLRAAR